MNEYLIDAFEVCLQDIKNGATSEECLNKFPHFAEELRPSLEAAVAAHTLGKIDVPTEVIQRSRTRVLGLAAHLRSEKPTRRPIFRFPLIVFSALMLALVLILGSRELVVVSAESLPGDSLYPIKRVVQDFRVRLAPNLETKHKFETLYRGQRIEEVQDLLAVGRIEMVSFEGVVNHIAPRNWDVDGIPVVLTEKTVLIGDISIGSLIEVEGFTSIDGWIEAHELHLREFELVGQVEEIGLDKWVISDLEFKITSSTQIYSGARVGDEVLVLARSRDNGSQDALAIIRLPAYIKNPEIVRKDPSLLISGEGVGEVIELKGAVEYISSTSWVIDGYMVSISLLTEVEENIGIGDFVVVHAIIGEDGTLMAQEIDLNADQADDNQDIKDDDVELDNGDVDDQSGEDDQVEDTDLNEDQEGSEDDRSGMDEEQDSDPGDDGSDNEDRGEDDGDSDDGSGDDIDDGSNDDDHNSEEEGNEYGDYDPEVPNEPND